MRLPRKWRKEKVKKTNTVGRLRRSLSDVAWVLEEKQERSVWKASERCKFQGESDLISLRLQVIGQIR